MNTHKIRSISIGAALVLLVVAVVVSSSQKKTAPHPTAAPQTVVQNQPEATGSGDIAKEYSLAEVSSHNSSASCWAAINGGVYDLTAWIGSHPGGEGPILSICGTDGSATFNAQHGGQGRPEAMLATFKIGMLK